MTHWIEIKPGVRFQVSGRVKQSAGMRRMAQYHHQGLSDAERRRGFSHALGGERAPLNKYSIALLDEAVALAMEIGVKGAVLKTGVKYWSIVQRKRILYLRGKAKRKNPGSSLAKRTKYTPEQKRRCVQIATQLMAEGKTKNAAFDYAARMTGTNARSLAWMHHCGMVT